VHSPADLDRDEDIDLQDLATLLAHFGTASGANFEDGDVDGDSDVELAGPSHLTVAVWNELPLVVRH
jgi:hypothetical protein